MQPSEIDLEAIHWQDWAENPYPLYRRMRNASPVYHDAANDLYLVVRYADCWGALIDAQRFSNVPHHLVDNPEARISTLRFSDPPRHTWIRKVVAPLFYPNQMRRLEPYFDQLADELLDDAESGDEVEVSSKLAIPLPGRVTCDLLGLPREVHARFLALTAERLVFLRKQAALGAGAEAPASVVGERSFDDIRNDLWVILEPIIEARKLAPANDAITLCAQAQGRLGKEQMTDTLIVDLLLQLLTGGFHTTQHLVEMFLDLMADRPDLWRQLREDPSLVGAAIEEMLRWDAPVQALPRFTVAEQDISGCRIPARSNLMMVYGSANRDERAYDDPDAYRLDRGSNRHVAFSAGIHQCPGAAVTRFEVRSLIRNMLGRYERIERAGPSRRRLSAMSSVQASHGVEYLPLTFVRA